MKWKISSSRITGKIHRSPRCQDSSTRVINDDYAAMILADGASSSEYASEASDLAVKTLEVVIKSCGLNIFSLSDDELRSLIVSNVRQALRDAAQAQGVNISDYMTTLLAIICTPTQYLAINIGDGLVAYIPDDENAGGETILAPVNGKYINTCYFITMDEAEEHIEIARGTMSHQGTYALMTDGSVTCLYNRSRQTYAPVLQSKYCLWLKTHPFNEVQDAITRTMWTLFTQLTADDCSLMLLRVDKE